MEGEILSICKISLHRVYRLPLNDWENSFLQMAPVRSAAARWLGSSGPWQRRIVSTPVPEQRSSTRQPGGWATPPAPPPSPFALPPSSILLLPPSSPSLSLTLALPFSPSTSIPLPFPSPFPSPSLNPFPLLPLPTPSSLPSSPPSSPALSLTLALPFNSSTSIPLPFPSPFPSPSLNPFPLLPLPTPSSPTLSLTYPLPFTPFTSIPIFLCIPLPFPLPLALPPSHLPSPSLRSPLFSQLNRLQTRFTVFSVSSRYTIKAVGYVSGNVKSPYQIIPAARIHIHPNYRMRRNANDFALVKLSRPIHFNKFIWPVCLPSIRGERPADVALPGNSGYFASPSSAAKVFLPRRKGEAESFVQLALKISSNRDCRNKTRQAFNASGVFCAGRRTAEKHSCRGDGGGPFVQREQRGRNAREMRWVLSGILSWNEECEARGRHGYFTRVAQYVAWVRGMTTRGKSSRNSKRRSRVWACDQFQISPTASPVI